MQPAASVEAELPLNYSFHRILHFLLLQLYFNTGLNEYVEPGFAVIRSPINNNKDVELHGSAFLIQTRKRMDWINKKLDITFNLYNLHPMAVR